MLITRCPHCETAFRIQAAHLEQAEGHVRCGRCANVFDAYQELRQSLSPTLTDLAEAGADLQPERPESVDEEQEFSTAEVDELERTLHTDDEGTEAPSDNEPKSVDSPPTITVEDPDDNEPEETAAIPADKERLEFNLPADQWQDFFSDTVVGEGEVPAISDTGVEWVVLGEVGIDDDSDVNTDPPEIKPEDADQPKDTDSELPADVQESTESQPSEVEAAEIDPDTAPDGHVMDLTAVAEQAPQGEDADEESCLVEDLFANLDTEPVIEPRRKTDYWYSGAALLLVLALCGQYVHYNRNTLATQVNVGSWLVDGYRRLGIAISPDWNLDQYQINRWVAASDTSDAENPSLKITAQITNRGPQAQPYPLVQLALKDRWDETVAGRVFEPAEYLSEGAGNGLLSPGDHIQAELKVLDPGQDAYGFELDVCMRADDQLLHCANEPQR
jgi:predicted Zn finger-like uncharacterized protein